MEFNNVKKLSPTLYKFTLAPSHVTYANTLRRLIMTGVETIAFRSDMTSDGRTTDVSIGSNTTPMTNEMLAHRIGLLPIHVKEPLKWNSDAVTFQLMVHGDKDTTKDVCAKDFKITKKGLTEDDIITLDTELFFPPNRLTGDTCVIATLYPGESQKIELIAKATIGTGREHARFQPTSQCSYEYTRDTDEAHCNEMFLQWLRDAKKVMVDKIDESDEKMKVFRREFNTMEIARCYLVDEKTGEPNSFDFTIETIGVLDIPYIVKRACEVGEAMVARYVNIDKDDVLPDDLRISPSEGRVLGFDFILRNQDHTLGNLLQTYMVDNHIDGTGSTKITFAGYKIPHPLRDEMLLRIGVEDGQEHTARKAFAEACKGCLTIFQQMKTAWMQANNMTLPVTAAPSASAPAPAARKIRITKK